MSQCGFILRNCEEGISTRYKCQNIFFLLPLLLRKPVAIGRLLFSTWTSAWLGVARWTGRRRDGLRPHLGLSAGFISSYVFPTNPFNYVHLLVSIMKRMSCPARQRQAEPTQTAPSSCFVHLQLVSSWDGWVVAGKAFACSCCSSL